LQLGYLVVDNRYFLSQFLNCCHNSFNSFNSWSKN
jgi:hypothetical protein